MAGYAFWSGEDTAATVRPIDVDTMSLFELQEAYYRGAYLVEIGTITQEMLERMPQLIDIRLSERDARRAAEARYLAEMNAIVTMFDFAHDNVIPRAAGHDLVWRSLRFGGYDWLVLDAYNNRVLVLLEQAISTRMAFHSAGGSVTWEASEMRWYLNNDLITA